jgi:acyl-CoA thioesterase-1
VERRIRHLLIRHALALLAALAVARCGGVELPTTPSHPPQIIVAFGDSLTSGPGLDARETYPALLERRLREADYNYRVINSSVSGDTSGEALHRLGDALTPSPAIMIVALGINDGLRGMSTAALESNLSTIVERAKSKDAKVLLCGMEAPPVHGLGYTVEFHRIYSRVAERYGIPLVPFFLINVAGRPNLNLSDGVHPNAAGHRIIADTLWPYLEPMLSRGQTP